MIRNTHINHVEDLFILNGIDGANQALDIFSNTLSFLSRKNNKNYKITTKWDGCVHPDSLLITASGLVKISKIILGDEFYKVLTYNEKTKNIEYCLATNCKINKNNKKWLKIYTEHDEYIIITKDHQVLLENKGWVEGKNIKKGDLIFSIPNNILNDVFYKVVKVEKLKDKYDECDITTENSNFFIANNGTPLLVHNSPSIIAGVNPKNNQFFVGTKSVFSKKQPKLNYTKKEIFNRYPNKLGEKLEKTLTYLSEINIKSILQGDLLYTSDILEQKIINNKKYIIFKPNTLTYAVPLDSFLGNKILNSKIGIVWHTEYSGKSLSNLNINFEPNTKDLLESSKVWFDFARYEFNNRHLSVIDKFNITESILKTSINLYKINDGTIYKFVNNKKLISEFMTYVNYTIKNDIYDYTPTKYFLNFLIFYLNKKLEKISKLSMRHAKLKHADESISVINFLLENKNEFIKLISIYKELSNIKIKLLKKLYICNKNQINIFIDIGGKLNPIDVEGYVINSKKENITVKFVDRKIFSKFNFLK